MIELFMYNNQGIYTFDVLLQCYVQQLQDFGMLLCFRKRKDKNNKRIRSLKNVNICFDDLFSTHLLVPIRFVEL